MPFVAHIITKFHFGLVYWYKHTFSLAYASVHTTMMCVCIQTYMQTHPNAHSHTVTDGQCHFCKAVTQKYVSTVKLNNQVAAL